MKKIIYLIIFISFFSCQSQKKEFLNKITNNNFKKLIETSSVINPTNFYLKEETFFKDKYPNISYVEISEKNSKVFFNLKEEELYYLEEFYNHDEDIMTYGKKISCLPYLLGIILNKNYISAIVETYNDGFSSGDHIYIYLYNFDMNGNIIDKKLLALRMNILDGVAHNGFGFIDATHFNTYNYDTRQEKDKDGKKVYKCYVTIKEYEINSNGKIQETKVIKEKPLKHSFYTMNGEWHDDDPMKIFIKETN